MGVGATEEFEGLLKVEGNGRVRVLLFSSLKTSMYNEERISRTKLTQKRY